MFGSLLRRGTSRSFELKTTSELPLYSPIATEHLDISASPTASTSDLNLPEIENGQSSTADLLIPAQRHAGPSSPASSSSSPPVTWLSRLSLSRFLADFTLGFADGLTVPFALTAGLSSLGQTDTVIYAGMAEICAGSISMGIGGYLSAKGETSKVRPEAASSAREANEKTTDVAVVNSYLAPLQLPPDILDLVRQHVISQPDVTSTFLERVGTEEGDDDNNNDQVSPSPVNVGLSIAAGYLIGGSLPLSPYFIVSHVGNGLMWSFTVCIIALFIFGFAKDLVLRNQQLKQEVWVDEKDFGNEWNRGTTVGWKDVGSSAGEGLRMVLLGSIAALAAVLCVRLFDGMGHKPPEA